MDLGKIGDSSTLVWLYCELCNHGKIIVRQGYREGLDSTKPSIWTFCPLLRKQFPRDRKLVEECRSCPHFKGFNRDPKTLITPSTSTTATHIHMIPAKKRKSKKFFSKEQFEEAVKEKERNDKEWKEEERRRLRDDKYEMS